MERKELPIGFGMELAENETAMMKFEALSNAQKEAIVQQSRNVHSREEMRRLVSRLANQ